MIPDRTAGLGRAQVYKFGEIFVDVSGDFIVLNLAVDQLVTETQGGRLADCALEQFVPEVYGS